MVGAAWLRFGPSALKVFLNIIGITCIVMVGSCRPACAHTINYQVENRGVSVRVFYGPDDPASYSSYEVFGPRDKLPHQKGRTDKNGFVTILPDRKGKWIIKVWGESEHGFHGVQIEVQINESLYMESFKKPLVARYTKAFVGVSFIMAIFGLWSLIENRRYRSSENKTDTETTSDE
ncbi:MAG: hypothetical protein ABFD81_18330 [Syntrophaceae bacterium]